MWTELVFQQKYSFDVLTQIWSVAPFTVDLLHVEAAGAAQLSDSACAFARLWPDDVSGHSVLALPVPGNAASLCSHGCIADSRQGAFTVFC
jgi:hypothetical protein